MPQLYSIRPFLEMFNFPPKGSISINLERITVVNMSNRDVVGIFDKSASNEMPLFMIAFK